MMREGTMTSKAYMTRSDIARELGVSYATACKIFAIADGIDDAQLGAYRVEHRVRRKTVEAVVQINSSNTTAKKEG